MMRRPRAVVTGAAIRVGRSVALELARAGFDLVVHYRGSQKPAAELAATCEAAGATVHLAQADLATVRGCRGLVEEVLERWDALELLVNNASAFDPVPFEEIGLDQWEAMLGVNLRAPFLLSQGLLPALRAGSAASVGGPEAQRGLVVHLCDIGADRPVSGYAHYSVSKAGLVMLVKAMAVELGPAIRAVGVSPGQVVWPEDYDEALRAKLRARIPLQRVGSPDDIARLIRFVALEGHYLNGVVLPVDGGLSQRY
jgi:pteridine reductase